MPLDESNLTLLTKNILEECANDYKRVFCTVIEPFIRGVQLPYVLTGGIEGPSATLDWDRLIEKTQGQENQNGSIEATIGGEKHTLYVTMVGRTAES